MGNVYEWTSTKNEKGEHLICGGAWTEEKYDPDKEEWRPPQWRDINLVFRDFAVFVTGIRFVK